ncbi:hypothetical protein DVR12_25480 [Chitinophaga silvatica]|uniref:Uncharacterized protein n=1 Tax=Chitinophaga silvatica TaxID=2282649 RepID=A0A3E1Y303_9BACT|nr:hypothetical protein [Chitinophaga silvatica]RFS19051.1 hypothetical protein DVR12_25480 [Chitinophaga silvatica]
MRPQDLVILLKIITKGENPWQLKDLSNSLYISNSEVSESLERSLYANLIDFDKKNVNRGNFLDFLLFGMKYVFPAKAGILTRGEPTAHSHPFMKEYISSDYAYVWASSTGSVIGQEIEPFYPNQIKAIKEDQELYKLLALLDVIRVGRLREISIAEMYLKKSLAYG